MAADLLGVRPYPTAPSLLLVAVTIAASLQWFFHLHGALRIARALASQMVKRQPLASVRSLRAIERQMTNTVRKTCKRFNSKRPEVLVIAHERNPQAGMIAATASTQPARYARPDHKNRERGGRGPIRAAIKPAPSLSPPPSTSVLPAGLVQKRRAANPREQPHPDADPDSLTYA